MNSNVSVIDRGIDEVMVIEGKYYRIDDLKGLKLIEFLNNRGINNIRIVNFDEYEKSLSK